MTEPGDPRRPRTPAAGARRSATPATARRDRWRVLRPLAHRDFRVLFGAVVLSIFAAGMWAVVMVYTVIDAGRRAARPLARRGRERHRAARCARSPAGSSPTGSRAA